MNHIDTQGLVLRRSDYGEFDRMVTLLTPDLGRVEVLARGCKRTKSPLKNAAELFTTGSFHLYRTARDRFTLEQCTITESFLPLRADLDRLTTGVYWLKLCYQLTQSGVPADPVFSYAVRALAYLCYSDSDAAFLTMLYEARMLSLTGFQPVTERCASCGKPLDGRAFFAPKQGGTLCAECAGYAGEISIEARRILYRACRAGMDKLLPLESDEAWREAAKFVSAYAGTQIKAGRIG